MSSEMMIAESTTTTTTTAPPPSTVIVSQLQGIVDEWETQNYPKVITLSHALLKRKKTIGDLGLTLPLQRLVLQAYLQQEDWDGLLKEASSSFVVTVNQQEDTIQDLILYAKYRKRDYPSVLDELTINTKNNDNDNNNDTTTTSTTSSSLSVLKQHLLAQSQYQLQLQHSYPTIQSTYQPIINSINDINSSSSSSTETTTISKLDLLTNQIATMISLQVIPMVRNTTGNQGEEQQSNIIQQAIAILQNKNNENHTDDDDDGKTDLALNVGLYQTLTATTTTTTTSTSTTNHHHDYLQLARDINQDDANNDVIDTALTWKRHFWYRNDNDDDDNNNNKDDDDSDNNLHDGKTIHYSVSSNTKNNSPYSSLTVPQSVAQFNQTLLLLDGSSGSNNKNRSVNKVPSQPHPKWNRIQIQLYWYNRALLQFQNEQYVECIESCHSLRKVTTNNNTNSNTISTATTNNTAAKKKKKNKPTTTTTTTTNITTSTTTFANTELFPDQAWWQARIDVLMAHVLHAQSKQAEAMQLLQQRLEQLKQQQQQQQQSESTSSFTIDHAIAHVQLHQYVLGNNNNKINNNNSKSLSSMKQLLETLPESIRSCPAVQWTLEEIKTKIVEQSYTINNNINENNSSTSQSPQTTTLQQANILFEQGQYEKACTLYNQTLTSDNNNDNNEEEEVMDAQLRYIQALVLTGQTEESLQFAKSVPWMNNDENGFLLSTIPLPDGEALEQKALPRSNTSTSAATTSNKTLGINGEMDNLDDTHNNLSKLKKEKMLRYRAKKREAYLQQLQSKDQYNPDRPTSPNPERWIPKHERSSNRRNNNNNKKGRNAVQNNKSSQGGGSQWDAERLDAAARRAGKVPMNNTGPSSANIKIGGGGPGTGSIAAPRGGRRR
ncbi:hypothetical protein IV203_016003 [Nitzschia inconspicua]|uniref:Signal recognition particle subunit SRP72 n=1 Tax=Nitzschia inconspicua TaxID=303405 RepID=A0A9K3KQK9_9STRA|nr:hypothetical protein IV203_016003 [Nitzschia inconspicua]